MEGYEFAVRAANTLNDGRGFEIEGADGALNYFQFNILADPTNLTAALDLASQAPIQIAALAALADPLGSYRAQFLLGSHPTYAVGESGVSRKFFRILFHCCVGPDTFYASENNTNMFGVQVSNQKYPVDFVKAVSLVPDEGRCGELSYAVIGIANNLFGNSTFSAALREINQSTRGSLMYSKQYQQWTGTPSAEFNTVIDEVVQAGAHYLFVTGFVDDASAALHLLDQKRALESFCGVFMTLGPTTDEFVATEGKLSHLLFSAGQWHYTQTISDDGFLGNSQAYGALYEASYDAEPHYAAAGATAVVHTIMKGIQRAFLGCTLPQGISTDEILFGANLKCADNQTISGYERLRSKLADTGNGRNSPILTIFGQVAFNEFRRNVGKSAVTTQILEVQKRWQVAAVYPLDQASYRATLPVLAAGGGGGNKAVVIGISVALAALVVAILGLLTWHCRQRRRASAAADAVTSLTPQMSVPFPSDSEAALNAAAATVTAREHDRAEMMRRNTTTRERANVLINDVVLGKCIGSGSFGRVYRAKWQGAADVAVKVILHPADHDDNARELNIASQLRHPNVVAMFESATRDVDSEETGTSWPMQETWMLLELCDGGTLLGLLSESTSGMFHTMLACRDIAAGMAYLHDNDVVHGDLKAANVLVQKKGSDVRGYILKVADFGLSHKMDTSQTHQTSNYYGTVTHASPEYMLNGKLSRSGDVYAYGMCMWEMISGERPWKGMPQVEIISRVVVNGETPEWPENAPAAYSELGKLCMSRDESKRPTFREIIDKLNLMLLEMQFPNAQNATAPISRQVLQDIGVIPAQPGTPRQSYNARRLSATMQTLYPASLLKDRVGQQSNASCDVTSAVTSQPTSSARPLSQQPSTASATPLEDAFGDFDQLSASQLDLDATEARNS